MPSRRSYLAALAAGLGGCTAGPGTGTTTDGTASTTTAPPDPPEGGERLPADDPALAWAVRLPDPVTTPPAVDAGRGRVYVGTGAQSAGTRTTTADGAADRGALVGLATADGGVDWRAPTAAPVGERPVVHRGRVHTVAGRSTGFTGADQRVLAYDPDGTRQWASDPRDEFLSLVGARAGTVFVGTHDDALDTGGETLFAVGAGGGVQWETSAGDAMGGTVAGGHLLYSAGGRALAAYDPADGRERWRVRGEPLGNPTASVAAFGGRCFTEAPDESAAGFPLVAHSTADGSEQWRYATATGGGNFVPTGVTPAPGGPAVVATEFDGAVVGLDGDGREAWTFTAGGDTRAGPVAGDAVYVGDSAGTVYALDPADGRERWRASLPDAAHVRPLSDGALAVSAGGGDQVVASFRADGRERWRYTTAKDLTRPAVAGDRAYAGADDGTVLAFAGRD